MRKRSRDFYGFTPDELERIRNQVADHTPSERRSVSWHMAKRTVDEQGRERASSFYAYAVTWTPGTLVVSGDLGDLTVNHWHAMPTLEATMDWLDGIEFDYFMEKYTQQRVYDQDATVEEIASNANEAALESMKNHRDAWREYRRDSLEQLLEWDRDETQWAVLGRVPSRWWSVNPTQRPILSDYLGEKPEPLRIERVRYPKHDHRNPLNDYEIPEGWRLWAAIWHECLDYEDPNIVFTAEGRRRLKDEMHGRLESQDGAITFCQSIGLYDYYGAYRYTYRQRSLFEAVKKWHAVVSPPYLEERNAKRKAAAEAKAAAAAT